MSLRQLSLTVLMALPILAVGAAAQQKNNEVAGLIGRTFISDQGVIGVPSFDTNLRFGNGLTVEGLYGRRIMGGGFAALTLEVPVVLNPDEDVHFSVNLVPEQYSSIFVTPSIRANLFAANAVSPWLSFGGGFGHFSSSSTLEFGGTNPGETGSTTGVLQFGAGLDVRIHGPFSVRGEFRDFYSGTPQLNVDTGRSRQHNLFVGGGMVWHF